MAKKRSGNVLSVAELEKMLDKRRTEVDKLRARRDSLIQQLEQLDGQISLLEGGGTVGRAKSTPAAAKRATKKRTTRKKRATRGTATKATRKKTAKKVKKKVRKKSAARGRRPKNSAPLGDFVLAALKDKKQGLSVKEIADAVQQAGYKTKSGKFRTVVYQYLYHSKKITRSDKTGNYVLK